MNNSTIEPSQASFTKGFAPKNQKLTSTNSQLSDVGESRKSKGFSALGTVKHLSTEPHSKPLTERLCQIPSTVPVENFEKQIRREFVQGSGIKSELFDDAIRFVSDYEELPGGEFHSPLCEAFEWEYRRFGRQARQPLEAAVFLNEDGSVWQGKLNQHRVKEGKVVKYETPVGNGSQPYLPPVDRETWLAIAQQHKSEIPPGSESFWTWVANHPEIPIIITEGGKKALCLLSQGYVAISLYGVHGGVRAKDSEGNRCKPFLIPELIPFISKRRQIILAFDQDAEAKTRSRVDRAIIRLASLLQKEGCSTSITFWDGRLGKGVDDLIVKQGALAWHDAYQRAIPFKEWLSHRKLLRQLTYAPATIAYTPDLSLVTFNNLPDAGILAIYAPKGTGKTKVIGQLIQNEEKALVATHRICLGRNLCDRLGVHWRGDLDKVKGKFIHGEGYALRVGFCVDSLLAIDSNKFQGCVLIIDEVVQVLRHLLTSATCRKGGKLPILLARLRELIQKAKLVVVADADLNNATLQYLQTLRGDGQPIHLIENQFKPNGYPCEFIFAPNASGTISRLLKALVKKQRIFISTDSKKQSKHLAYHCYRLGLNETDVLLLNSETSGGNQEQAFIKSPDKFLAENPQIRVVIASPSLCTGVSIESKVFDQVFGLFWGASLTDADIAQGLLRVRDTIPRTIWCAQIGRNLCQFSRSTFAGDIIQALKTRTDSTVAVLRSNLREDIREQLTSIDWNSDPHIRLFAQIAADTNYSMWNLRSALLARLRLEGHQIKIVDMESDPIVQAAMKEARNQTRQIEAKAVSAAALLSNAERVKLESQEYLTSENRLSLIKTALADFYCVDEVTPELVLEDKAGLCRSRLLALEHQLYPETAQRRDIQALEKQMQWSKGICPWDISSAHIKRETRMHLGLDWYLDPERIWTKYDNEIVAQRARTWANQVKTILGLGNLNKISGTQIVHQLLSQLNLKTTFRWSTKVPGHEGEKLRVYQLDIKAWNESLATLKRRLAQRKGGELLSAGSPSPFNKKHAIGGDPRPKPSSPRLDVETGNCPVFLQKEEEKVLQISFPTMKKPIGSSVNIQRRDD